MEKEDALKRTFAWWYCDNVIDHPEQVGLLHMGFPRVFILMRNYDAAYFATFEEWKNQLIEVTFFENAERDNTTEEELEEILIGAWNFLLLTEEEEERLSILSEEDEMLGDL